MDESQKNNFPKVLFATSLFMVIAAIIAGLIVTGGPMKQRKMRMDEKRVKIMLDIAKEINQHYKIFSKLPANLKFLADTDKYRDPKTAKMPEYIVLNKDKYRICQVYELSNKENLDHSTTYGDYSTVDYEAQKVKHAAGYVCGFYEKDKNYNKPGFYIEQAFKMID